MRKSNSPAQLLACLAVSSVLAGCASTSQQSVAALQAVPAIDASRYTGKWYEVARLPNRFQDQCAGNVTATYEQDGRGGLSVLNQCLTASGTTEQALGRARRTSDTEGKLKVSFLPSLLSRLDWLPFGWGDYWILDLPSDYSHALVGSPDKKFLWVLSRNPDIEEPVFFRLMQKAADMGYNTGAIERTPQGVTVKTASK
jgi:apolipoprotein D and lipocalin family protein